MYVLCYIFLWRNFRVISWHLTKLKCHDFGRIPQKWVLHIKVIYAVTLHRFYPYLSWRDHWDSDWTFISNNSNTESLTSLIQWVQHTNIASGNWKLSYCGFPVSRLYWGFRQEKILAPSSSTVKLPRWSSTVSLQTAWGFVALRNRSWRNLKRWRHCPKQ